MGGAQFEVDPDRVAAVAAEIAQVGEALRTARTAREPGLGPTASQAMGWSAADTARAAATSWVAFLDRLAGSADRLAARLRSAARSYEASDARSGASLRKQYAE